MSVNEVFLPGFEADAVHYETTEHYMLAEEAGLFGIGDVGEKIVRWELRTGKGSRSRNSRISEGSTGRASLNSGNSEKSIPGIFRDGK